MKFDMTSSQTTILLAVVYGLANIFDELILGAGFARLFVLFLGSTIVGTLIVMGVVWVVLAILKKRHLLCRVTNWVLVVGICVSLISALLATGAT